MLPSWGGERSSRDDRLTCLIRQVPHLTHKRPGVKSGSSSSHSLSSVPDTLTCHRQEGQHGGSLSHQSPGGLPVAHPEQACAPAFAQDKFLSLRAVHVPGVLNLAADFLSRQKLRLGEWMLNHHMVDQIWERFGAAAVDLFASQESTQCPLWFSLSHPISLGIDALVYPWSAMKLYAFPPVKLISAVLRRVKTCRLCLLLVAPFWPSHTWFLDLVSLLEGDPWEIPVRKDLFCQL